MAGRKFQIGNVSLFIVKRDCSYLCMWMTWKQNLDPMWKVLNKEVDLGEPTSFLDHVYLGCTQRQWRLRLPLPLSVRSCRCGRAIDIFGHHRAVCSRAGVLGRQGFALESAVARICREAGGRVAVNTFMRDVDLRVNLACACVKAEPRLCVCQRVGPFFVPFGSILGSFFVHFLSILGPFLIFGSMFDLN